MDKLTAIRIKYSDGSYSDQIPVSVQAGNVIWDSTHSLTDMLGNIDISNKGNVQQQINRLFTEKFDFDQLTNYVDTQLSEDVTNWLEENITETGSAIMVDSSLTIEGAAADAKETGNIKNSIKPLYTTVSFDIINNSYWTIHGMPQTSSNWGRTERIPCVPGELLTITTPVASNYNVFFNSDTDGDINVSFKIIAGENQIRVPENANYYGLSNTIEGINNTTVLQIINGNNLKQLPSQKEIDKLNEDFNEIKNFITSINDLQNADLWKNGKLSVINGNTSESNQSIVSNWIYVNPGSTLTTLNNYRYSYIITDKPETYSLRLEYKTLGKGQSIIQNEGYLRISVAPPTDIDIDISIRSNLLAKVIQNQILKNTYSVDWLNKQIDNIEDGLTKVQNNEFYYKTILNSYVTTNGEIVQYSGWSRTDYIPISNIAAINIIKTTSSVYNVFYNQNKEKISSFYTPVGTTSKEVPENAYYVILSDTAIGMDNTVITPVKEKRFDDKSILFTNPYFSERYIGDTVEGETFVRSGIYFHFDSIEINTNNKFYTVSWEKFLTDLNDSFGPNLPINAPVVAADYTTNCARMFATWSLVYNLISEKFELVRSIYKYEDNQIIIIGLNSTHGAFGPLYETSILSSKRGLECYRDTFNEIQYNTLSSLDDFIFTFATDCHYPYNDKTMYYNPTNEIIKAIDDAIHVDAIINGGDSELHGTKNRYYSLGAYNHIFSNLPQNKIIYCMGNHDWNGVSGINYQQSNTWMLNNEETNALFMRHNENVIISNNADVKYFYRDFTNKKIRVIVLNTSDIDVNFTNDIVDIDPLGILGIRQAQLTWLTDVALNVPDNDWHVLIIMHGGLYLSADGFPGNTDVRNKEAVINILSAYVNKTTYSYSNIDTQFNNYFTINGNGTFSNYYGTLIAVFSGHAHADGYCNKDGFNAIQTECSYLDYDQKPQRLVRTIDEIAVDCVSVNKINRTINITRFGYGDNRTYTY